MAIAFDAAANGSKNGASPLTYSHTCTGSDMVLVVAVAVQASGASAPSSVTYNGDALTKIVEQGDVNDSDQNTSIWMLANPDTGSAYTISIAYSGTTLCAAFSASYTGCDTGDPAGGTGSGFNSSPDTAVSAGITTDTADSWVIGFATTTTGTSITESGMNSRVNTGIFGGKSSLADKSVASPGATTVDWTAGANCIWKAIAAELHAAGGGGGAVLPYRALLGVGI